MGRIWRGRERELGGAGGDVARPKIADAKWSRARLYTHARREFPNSGNIPSEFSKLLEKLFCVFAKKYRIQSRYWELLDMLYTILVLSNDNQKKNITKSNTNMTLFIDNTSHMNFRMKTNKFICICTNKSNKNKIRHAASWKRPATTPS